LSWSGSTSPTGSGFHRTGGRGLTPLAGVYATYDQATNAYSAEDAAWTEHGWRIKILHLIEPGQDAPVELSGIGVGATSGTVLLEVEGGRPAVRATFDPNSQPATHEGWREFPTYAYFPSAGCYRFTANWPGGSWQLGFGIGR
jgi:hypothetical protein